MPMFALCPEERLPPLLPGCTAQVAAPPCQDRLPATRWHRLGHRHVPRHRRGRGFYPVDLTTSCRLLLWAATPLVYLVLVGKGLTQTPLSIKKGSTRTDASDGPSPNLRPCPSLCGTGQRPDLPRMCVPEGAPVVEEHGVILAPALVPVPTDGKFRLVDLH